MARCPKFDRPISVDEAQQHSKQLAELKKKACYIGNPEHKKSPNHDFGCIPLAQHKREKTCCDEVNIFNIKIAISLLRKAFDKGLVSHPDQNKEWPRRVWAVTDSGEVVEGRLSGDGQYHGFPVLNDSPIVQIVKNRW